MKMEAPSNTNMDVVPEMGMLSTTMTTVAPIVDTTDIFEGQRDSEWQMMGWHIGTAGGTTVYHCRGCTTCSTYAAHLMTVRKN